MTIHLPSETAMALAMAMTDPTIDLMIKRSAAAAAIEDLINFLDDTDGDADFEPSLGYSPIGWAAGEVDLEGGDVQDEPHDEIDEDGRDMSWPEGGPRVTHTSWLSEDDEISDHDEDGGDSEPSLAAPEARIQCQGPFFANSSNEGSQLSWAKGSRTDGEDTNEDGGDILDEPHDWLDEGNEETEGWSLTLTRPSLALKPSGGHRDAPPRVVGGRSRCRPGSGPAGGSSTIRRRRSSRAVFFHGSGAA